MKPILKLLEVLVAFILCALPMEARAQLVADGQTNVLDGVTTNLTSGVIIGTNGAFTLLVVTDGATVTNSSGNTVIGNNASAQSNRVTVTGAGSIWNNGGNNFNIGLNGSASELDILNGGLVTDASGSIGQTSVSSNNFVLVSGAGSMWTNSSSLIVGYSGSRNTLVVTNGGKVFSGDGVSYIGESISASSNAVLITGSGSSWNCDNYLYLGYISGGHDQFLINNGGAFIISGMFDIGVYTSSNLFMVADAGSLLQCSTFRIGYSSTGNQCIVSNGATLSVLLGFNPAVVEGTFTTATITGPGSLFTNSYDFDFGQASNVLSITGGGTLVDNNGYVQGGAGKPNTVIVAGANSLWNNRSDFHVADAGTQLLITNGGTMADNYGYFGDNAGNNNCYALVSGSGSVWTNRYDLYVGNNGASNQLVVTDSGKVAAQNLYLGGNTSSTNNTVTMNGGNLIITGSFVSASTIYGLRGTLTLNSGLVKCDALSFNNGISSKLVFNGGTLQVNRTTVNNGNTLVVGDGTDAATFQMLNSGTHTFSGGLVVSSNALFTGAGSVNGNVFIGSGGTFVPGTTNIWFITMNNRLVLSNGCTTVLGLSPSSGNANNVQGLTNVIYGGTLQLTNLGGTYASGQSYTLFSAGHYDGAFNNLVPSTPGPGLRWDTNELNVDGVLRVLPAIIAPPVIGSVAISGGNLIVNASSGIAYDPVYLLTSTNLVSPISDWTCWSINYFDANGAVSITNIIVPGELERYFLLQVQ